MSETTLLVGSLSNDMFRIASLQQRGSTVGARRFLRESKRWAGALKEKNLKRYLMKIVEEVLVTQENELDTKKAEDFLMYGILLQNHASHSL